MIFYFKQRKARMPTPFYSFQWLNSVNMKKYRCKSFVLLKYIQIIGRKLYGGYMIQGQYTQINCIFLYISDEHIQMKFQKM